MSISPQEHPHGARIGAGPGMPLDVWTRWLAEPRLIETAEGREVWKTAWKRVLTGFTTFDQENR
ncbi:hypothetical protein CFK39_12040 [Brachybacterium avium]|uniref:Uncharacterized protein n=1 Tax=Brachybacterium avium TaxID=2017485 RepID=A0A220UEA1_9MICO|nr:hypothetical protein [Brachybacterium avium]ASK66425.1 hypothetical protein CFK39_12040 [Brachybacterium avium]